MKLNLDRDLIVLDLESTGLSPAKDLIIQIAMLKIFADGRPNELKCRYVNPGIPIPKEVTDITHITDDMVKDAPRFSQIAKGIMEFIGNADLVTFNGNRFDIPLLVQSFWRCGLTLDFTNRRYVDVKRIFHRMEPRDLRSAYRMFVGRPLENAHDAGADVGATIDVLEAMLDKYQGAICVEKDDTIIEDPIKNNINDLYEFTKNYDELDWEGWIKMKDNTPCFGKGKYMGQPIGPVLLEDRGYYDWIMIKGEFTNDTRVKLEKIMTDYRKTVYEKSANIQPKD